MIQKIGINQLKFSKGKKIYAKGDAAHFAYYVHSGKVNISYIDLEEIIIQIEFLSSVSGKPLHPR